MRKIAVYCGSRADSSPLTSVIKSLGEHAIIIQTEGLCGHEAYIKKQLEDIRPDMLLVLGDRYESLVAASVAALLAIPIAHCHGGEITEGAVDDAFRHAITKLAYWHFPSCGLHADRICALGENGENIFVYGAPGVDALAEPIMTKEECERSVGKINGTLALVSYHPETLGSVDWGWLEQVKKYDTIIIVGPNQDIGNEAIKDFLMDWARDNSASYALAYSHRLWISLMHHADALIGNSSGFIIEGMALQQMRGGKPEIIIVGERQKGRHEEALEMFKPMGYYQGIPIRNEKQLFPFGRPGTVGKAIAEKLLSVEIPKYPRKKFYAR